VRQDDLCIPNGEPHVRYTLIDENGTSLFVLVTIVTVSAANNSVVENIELKATLRVKEQLGVKTGQLAAETVYPFVINLESGVYSHIKVQVLRLIVIGIHDRGCNIAYLREAFRCPET
jgi:hypothetical protein